MPKLPYWRHFPSDRTADAIDISTTAYGLLMRLSDRCWHTDTPGVLPSDKSILIRWSRLTPALFEKHWLEILHLLKNNNDTYSIPWLVTEHEKFEERRAQLQLAGEAGVKARGLRHLRHRPSGKHMVVIGESNDNHAGNGSGDGNETSIDRALPTEKEFVSYCTSPVCGIMSEEATGLYHKLDAKGWKDGAGNQIEKWQSYCLHIRKFIQQDRKTKPNGNRPGIDFAE